MVIGISELTYIVQRYNVVPHEHYILLYTIYFGFGNCNLSLQLFGNHLAPV